MSDKPNLAELEQAVEEAWENINFVSVRKEQHIALCNAMANWLAVRCAAREAGMVGVMVNQDTLTALHFGLQWMDERNVMPNAVRQAMDALARDPGIAAVLKEPTS